MPKSVFVKVRKINSVKDNIKYLKSTKEHPEFCETYSTCDLKMWNEYAEKNQKEFLRSGQSGKCVEAHEMILVLPQEYYELSHDQRIYMMKKITDDFKQEHEVEAYAAMHASDSDANNMHIHLMYQERRIREVKEKIATRKTWIDSTSGRKIRTKKEAYENGELKPGVIEYKKGEAIKSSEWTAKDKYLKSNKFTTEVKRWWKNKINELTLEFEIEAERRFVFDGKTNPNFKMSKLRTPLKYKDPEKQKRSNEQCEAFNRPIIATNKLKKQYNKWMIKALMTKKINLIEAMERKERINSEIRELCLNGQKKKIRALFEHEVREMRKIAQPKEVDMSKALKDFEEKTNFKIPQMSEREQLELEIYELKEKLETKSVMEKLELYKEIARVENKIKELDKVDTKNRQDLGRER